MNCCRLDPLYCATHYKEVTQELQKARQRKTDEVLALLRTALQLLGDDDYVEFMRNMALIEYVIKDLEGKV